MHNADLHGCTPATISDMTSAELFDAVPAPMMLIDAQGRIVRANPAECALLQYSQEEMEHTSLWEFIADEEVGESQQRFQEVMGGLDPQTAYRRRFKTKNNDYVTCDLTVKVIRKAQELHPLILLRSTDITLQVAEQRARGEYLRWLEAAYRCLPEAVVILDALGYIRKLNTAAQQLLGWKESEAVGAFVDELLPWSEVQPQHGRPSDYGFLISISASWSGSAIITTRGGEPRHLFIRTEPIVDPNGLVLGIVSCLRPL